MIFDQIFTNFDKILTISVKNHSIHVENFQECHFLNIKKTNVKNHPGFGEIWILGGDWGIYGGGYWGEEN